MNNANAICKHIVKVAQANRTKPNFAKELAKPTQDKIGFKISQRFKKIKNNKRTEKHQHPTGSLAKWRV